MIVTPTEDDIYNGLRAFLQNVLPLQSTGPDVGHVVIVGQVNRVSEPSEDNYVVMWPLRMPRLSTNVERLATLGLLATFEQSSQCVMQLDLHGPEAFNNASIVSTMFRSSYAVEFFEARGSTIAPLFADDPRQMPFTSGEQQYESRYVVEANLQVNQTITAIAQSAQSLELETIDVETDPDSWPNTTTGPITSP